MKLIPFLAILLLIFLIRKPLMNFLTQPNLVANLKKAWIKYALFGLLGLSLVLVAAGKVHWIGAIITGCFVLFRTLLPHLLSYLPQWLLRKHQNDENKKASNKNFRTKAEMSTTEALAILGLQEDASREDIIKAHRKLMSKLHPDKGGNDFLASQLNRAKETLIG